MEPEKPVPTEPHIEGRSASEGEDNDETEITTGDDAEFNSLCSEIDHRCTKGKLKCEQVTSISGKYLRVLLKSGRGTYPISVSSVESAKRLLQSPFEKIVILAPFIAICMYDTRTIFAAVTWRSPVVTPALKKLLADGNLRCEEETDSGLRVVEIGPRAPILDVFGTRLIRPLALQLSGFAFSNFDEAKKLLEQVSDAVFLGIDLNVNVALSLAKDRQRFGVPKRRSLWVGEEESALVFPRTRYDSEPMSLYWYARQARGMPLLEFLAYYQCIEFYFSRYAEAEARKRIQTALKDPTFDPARDDHITRMVQILDTRKGGGDERTQLKATVAECVDLVRLEAFFCDEEQRQFFSKNKELAVKLLPLERGTVQDIRDAVAERIYEIRCKVVHTKGAVGAELLLPFSKEAGLLGWDIELVQFVARNVLIASSQFV